MKKKSSFNPWWYVAVVFAFASTIGFFQIDGEFEKYNTFFWVGSIAFALIAAYALYRVATDGSTPKD